MAGIDTGGITVQVEVAARDIHKGRRIGCVAESGRIPIRSPLSTFGGLSRPRRPESSAYVTRWRLAPAGSVIEQPLYSVLPANRIPSAKWRDLHAYTPPVSKPAWVRRFTLDTNPFTASWVAAAEPYFLLANGWQLPWYLAWQWRPV